MEAPEFISETTDNALCIIYHIILSQGMTATSLKVTLLVLTRLFMCNSGVSRDLPIEIDGYATRGHAISFSG